MIQKNIFALGFLLISNFIYSQSPQTSQTTQFDLKDLASQSKNATATVSQIPLFTVKEKTQGTQYLFNDWVRGTVFRENGLPADTRNLFFNYDKIGKRLLATSDKKLMIDVDKNQLTSFSLASNDDTTYTFKKIKIIDSSIFFLVVTESETGFSLYKTITTKFIPSNYEVKGIIESGNPYDEYKDSYEYYVVMPGSTAFKKLDGLKAKSIKSAFINSANKINTYFKENPDAEINELFLIGLISYLN